MGRIARAVAIGVPHHITQIGNDKQQVFFDDADRRMFLRLLGERGEQEGVRLLGYCLMSNHTHYVVIPDRPLAFARWLGYAHLRYTQYFNLRYGHCGRLWRNRFYSCPLDNRHLAAALRYVDRNPARAGLVEQAWEWAWSSAQAHVEHQDPRDILDMAFWHEYDAGRQWREVLATAEDGAVLDSLRKSTRTGRPLGTTGFVKQLESHLHRGLAPGKPGRPKKKARAMAAPRAMP